MNLNRAKTILIIAFLGLNIFLAYHLLAQADRLPLKVVSEPIYKRWKSACRE